VQESGFIRGVNPKSKIQNPIIVWQTAKEYHGSLEL
jgi:hypothetical protein